MSPNPAATPPRKMAPGTAHRLARPQTPSCQTAEIRAAPNQTATGSRKFPVVNQAATAATRPSAVSPARPTRKSHTPSDALSPWQRKPAPGHINPKPKALQPACCEPCASAHPIANTVMYPDADRTIRDRVTGPKTDPRAVGAVTLFCGSAVPKSMPAALAALLVQEHGGYLQQVLSFPADISQAQPADCNSPNACA